MVSSPHRHHTQLLISISRRILEGVATALAAVTFAFFALFIAGGDPVSNLVAQGLASPSQAEAIRVQLGLNQPLLKQYADYMMGLIRGDFGTSLFTARPVLDTILEQLPSTLELALASWIIAIFLGLLLGLTAGWRHRSIKGRFSGTVGSLATALPVAFTGILAIFLVDRIQNALFPIALPHHLLLPAIVLGFATAGPIAKVTESSLQSSKDSGYIQAARTHGISDNIRLMWHALRPIFPAILALIALQAAFLLSGTVVTETVFARPGIGRLLVSSILTGDYPVARGVIVIGAVIYTASHIAGDLIAIILDPRIRRAQ